MNIKKLLGDTILVEHISVPTTSNLIEIPETAQHSIHTTNVQAKVIGVGTKCRHDLIHGDVVLVPYHLGTRLDIIKYPRASGNSLIIYDGEDVLAIIRG